MVRRLAITLLVALAMTACSEPPVKERHQADVAIASAQAAGAVAYAPVEFQEATAAIKKYDDALAQRDYRQALSAALEARDRADEATKQAGSKKAEMRGRADQLIRTLESLTKAATARSAGPTGRQAGAAATRRRAALRAGNAALQEARTRVGKQDYQGAIDKLTPAIEALRRETPASAPPAAKRKK